MKTTTLSKNVRKRLFLVPLLTCSLLVSARAVNPPPDGGYPGGNTAEGQNALLNLSTGTYNTAVGFSSLKRNTVGTLNTAIGVNALSFNNAGRENTATGVNALYSNAIGFDNTANGVYALFYNYFGAANTATGAYALFNNTGGSSNAATGYGALYSNTTGFQNTATGTGALTNHITGDGNTAVGSGALIGNLVGSLNTALGENAGSQLNGGESNNIDIGANVDGVSGESNTIRIGNADITDTFISGISGTTVASGAAVLVGSNGQLGTVTSSKRFKDNIKPMDKASEALLALKPVTFRYKKEIDPAGISQFGLIAEEVAKVNPDLVVRDKEGTLYTVRYDAVNAMLLNEFLKEHRKVEQLEKQVETLTAGLERVNAQVGVSKALPQMVLKDR
jgi:Chaperone of endosialidase